VGFVCSLSRSNIFERNVVEGLRSEGQEMEGLNDFVPINDDALDSKVPYLEDARADYAPYYQPNNQTIAKAKNAIIAEMGKLGGTVLRFREGDFGSRRGYVIEFVLNGVQGRIKVAGLPLRRYTSLKMDRVRIQALMNIRDWLKTAVTSMIFSPGNNPLVPHLLGKGGRTLVELISEDNGINVPLLEGELVEDSK
jgi:hypothetical protein